MYSLPPPATLARHKYWCRKNLTEQNIVIFTHVNFLTVLPHNCFCWHTLEQEGVINMCGKEVHFLVVVVCIAGSSCYWNERHIKCCTFSYRQNKVVWGWIMNLLVGCFKGAPPSGTQQTEGKIVFIKKQRKSMAFFGIMVWLKEGTFFKINKAYWPSRAKNSETKWAKVIKKEE